MVLGRVQQYLATTPPELRCPCNKGVVLEKARQHLAGCDARPGLLLMEEKLHKEKLKEMAAQREQQYIKVCQTGEGGGAGVRTCVEALVRSLLLGAIPPNCENRRERRGSVSVQV